MAFPEDPLDVEVELLLNDTWVDAVDTGNGIRLRDPITVRRGQANWSARPETGRASWVMDNRDGRWSPDNPDSPHAGHYRRNIPCRVGLKRGDPYLGLTGTGSDPAVASTPDILGAGGGAPTAPDYETVTTDAETTNTTTHTFDMPAAIDVTDRLLMIVHAKHNSLATTDLDDWTLVVSDNLYVPWDAWHIYELEIVDQDTHDTWEGATVEFTTTTACTSSCQVIRTSGARSGGEGVAWDYIADTVKTFSDSPNPPSLTTDWGADEHRWYAIAIYGSGTDRVTSSPFIASYTDISDSTDATNVLIATAHRTTAVTTEDPGAMTLAGDENWMCVTFVYRAIEDTSADDVLDITGDIDQRIEFQLNEDPGDIDEGTNRIRLAHKRSGAGRGGNGNSMKPTASWSPTSPGATQAEPST